VLLFDSGMGFDYGTAMKREREMSTMGMQMPYQQQGMEKRVKKENPPAKVLFARNLAHEAVESDLQEACAMFGVVSKVLFVRNKNQAFIQMEDVESAQRLMTYYKSSEAGGAKIKNRTVFFEYSDRSEITMPTGPAAETIFSSKPTAAMGRTSNDTTGGGPNRILLVTISQVMYPVDVDLLYQVFSPYGVIQRIVTFVKNDQTKALVEFELMEHALHAMQCLNMQYIYNGCNLMEITYSTMLKLSVKFNNEKSRDFTLGTPALGAVAGLGAHASMAGLGAMHPHMVNGQQQMQPAPPAHPHPGITGMADAAYSGLEGAPAMNFIPPIPPGQPPAQWPQAIQGSPVVIVSGLSTNCTPDILFTLFGVYGDVKRVKIMYNKRDVGLVQFFDPTQARTACENLSGAQLFDSLLRVNESKHAQISMPTEESQFTKDYENSNLHRYRRGVKNAKNICPPSPMLHVSNIPESAQTSDETLKPLFETHGEVKSFRFFENDRRMAIVEMADTATATHALISLHNTAVADKLIKVSFSKKK